MEIVLKSEIACSTHFLSAKHELPRILIIFYVMHKKTPKFSQHFWWFMFSCHFHCRPPFSLHHSYRRQNRGKNLHNACKKCPFTGKIKINNGYRQLSSRRVRVSHLNVLRARFHNPSRRELCWDQPMSSSATPPHTNCWQNLQNACKTYLFVGKT